MGQRASVGVAEHHAVGTVDHGGLEHAQGELGVGLVPVEEVFGIEEDAQSLGLEEGHRLPDHGHTLLEGGAQRLDDVEVPALAHDAGGGGAGLDERGERGIHIDSAGRATCGPEGDQLRGAELQFARGALEELGVLGIGLGIAALDPAHPEVLELFGDAELVLDGERDPLELCAIAQGRVEDLDRCRQRPEGVVSGHAPTNPCMPRSDRAPPSRTARRWRGSSGRGTGSNGRRPS